MEKQSTRKFLKLIVALVALFLLGASALMLASCNKDEHVHSYKSSVTTPATCSNPGVETFTCSCGLTYTQIIPANGEHSWEKVKEYPASCESEGWTVYECSVCHAQKQDDWVQKRDHKYEAVETVEATCTTDGYQIMQCSYCGDRYTDDQYSSEHKATGHKWIVNTDAEDPASDEDKKLGFVTVKEADCLNAAQLERTCSVCGHTEDKEGAPALGHMLNEKTVEKVPCKVDLSLIDKDGNTGFAFECERENCPVTVTIDNAGNTRHYITASAHKMKVVEEKTFCVAEDSDEVLPTGTNASGKGYRYEICENCDTYGTTADATKNKVTELEPTGHKWNTVQVDGKTPVVVCEQDTGLTRTKYQDLMKAALGTTKYATVAGALQSYFKDGTKYSRYCSDCGALTVAGGHEYVVSPLEEGKYDLEDYQKDENGLPVVAEGVTAATMDCRYVQVCKNEGCGKVLERGQHGTVSDPTCRKGGYCEVCGEEFKAQLAHSYVDVSAIADEANWKNDPNSKDLGSKTYTNKQLYDAWKKVSATETWMVPVEGGCDEKSTTVTICETCLMTAADEKSEEEVVWNQATEKPNTLPTTATSTNAYVVTSDFGHDYVPVYYTLDGQERVFTQITCAVGFNVKYVCDKCGEVYTNVPVADDPLTTKENTEKPENVDNNWWVESAVNAVLAQNTVTFTDPYGNEKTAKVFTDADGFVLTGTGITADENFTASKLAAALASKEDNKGDHVVTVASEYAKRNGYVASTCISTAEIPVVCENCGAALSYTYEQLKTESNTDGFKYVWAEDTENSIDSLEDAVNAVVKNESDRKLNYLNHAEGAKIFDCGTHCDASTMVNGVKTYICSGYVDGHATTANITAASSNFANMFNEDFHSTVTISYKLTVNSNYYSDYTIRVATVSADAITDSKIDWTKVTFSNDSKLSVCAANKFDTLTQNTSYTAPSDYSKAAEGTYFVLTDAEGNNYFVKDFKLYTDDKGETQGTAIEGEGSTTAAQDDTYFLDVTVCEAPIHATDEASLEKAITNAQPEKGVLTVQFAAGKTIKLADNSVWTTVYQKINGDTSIKSLVFDFNGGSVSTGTAIPFDAWGNCKAITFKNGTFNFTNPSGYAITVNSKSALTLTFEDVDIVSKSNAIKVDYEFDTTKQSKVVLKDSTITSYGQVGVSVDEPTETNVPATLATVIDMTNTNIVMTKALPTDTAVLATAMVVGAPVNVKVSGGEFSANGQVLVVRGGDVSVSTTKLTLNAYTDTRVVVDKDDPKSDKDVLWSTLFNGQTSAVADPWDEFIAGVTDVQTYRMAGLWGTGADVARAAVVLGNNDTGNYKFEASLRLDRANIVVGDGEQTVVVGTTYDQSVFDGNKATTGTAPNTTTTYTPVVTLNATGSALSADRVVYTYNAYNTTTGALNNAEYISMVGLIPVAD